MAKISYPKPLFILAFDHRTSFVKSLIGATEDKLTAQQLEQVKIYKDIIYQGFKQALASGIPKNQAAILIDEEFGSDIIQDAKNNKINICLPIEKSGQEVFDFQYGANYFKHIEKYHPTIVKVLLRYNPDDDAAKNMQQKNNLKIASDYCQANGYPFMIEALIPPTMQQLQAAGSKENYDKNLRLELTIKMIKELQAAGIKSLVWKIEGFNNQNDYKKVAKAARGWNRRNVGIIILGRGQDKQAVESWLKAGAKTKGIVGFAIGRTIFLQPLLDLKEKRIDALEAAQQIGKNYLNFYKYFLNCK